MGDGVGVGGIIGDGMVKRERELWHRALESEMDGPRDAVNYIIERIG